MDSHYVILYRPGHSWVIGKSLYEQKIADHVKYVERLLKEKKLVQAGPFADGSGALAIIAPTTEQTAHEIMSSDPGIVDGVWEGELHQWTLL